MRCHLYSYVCMHMCTQVGRLAICTHAMPSGKRAADGPTPDQGPGARPSADVALTKPAPDASPDVAPDVGLHRILYDQGLSVLAFESHPVGKFISAEVCIHTYIHTHRYTYMCIHVHTYIHTYASMHTCICIHDRWHSPSSIHIYIHTYICIHDRWHSASSVRPSRTSRATPSFVTAKSRSSLRGQAPPRAYR